MSKKSSMSIPNNNSFRKEIGPSLPNAIEINYDLSFSRFDDTVRSIKY